MKLNFTPKSIIALTLFAGLLFVQPVFASGKAFRKTDLANNEPEKEEPAKKEKAKSKAFSSLNNSSVKIHPAVIKRQMHVVAKGNEGNQVDFFVFDLQGTLIQHYKMKPKSHYKLNGLKKGQYVYSVFNGDEETASGKFEIR